MIGKESKGNKAVAIHEVVEILESKRGGKELTYEQQLALEHAKKFTTGKSYEKVRKALEELGILSEKSVLKLLEVMPKNQMLIKQILAQERKTFSDEEVNKILAITKEKG